MASAARRPSARAVTTRSAPFTLSPPAKTPLREVRPPSSMAMRAPQLVLRPLVVSGTTGSAP